MEVRNMSTTAADNNNNPPHGFAEEMPAREYNNTARELMSSLKRWFNVFSLSSTFANNKYSVSPGMTYSAPQEGDFYVFRAAAANTGACTLQVDSHTPVSIVGEDGNAVPGNTIKKDNYIYVTYDGSNYVLTFQSYRGLDGQDGARGATGPQGTKGATGTQGPQGKYTVNIYNRSSTALSSAPTGGSIVISTGVVTPPTGWTNAIPAGSDQLYVSRTNVDPATQSGTVSPTWSVPFQAGAQGPTGPRGPQGPAGAAGADGATGPQGDKGDKGDKGDRGDRGFAGSQGPKGDPGQRGQQGARGPQGATGSQGPTGARGSDGSVTGDVNRIEVLTQTEYNNSSKSDSTLYLITR